MMSLDRPFDGEVLTQPIQFSGWALDLDATAGTGVDGVEIWAYSLSGRQIKPFFISEAKYGYFREDVVKTFGWQFGASGYEASVSGLTPGGYVFIVRARNAEKGHFDQSRQVKVWVAGGPQMSIDGPPDGSSVSEPFTVWGWAIDSAAEKGTGVDAVQIWAFTTRGNVEYAILLGEATYGLARDDVALAFGKQFLNAGFALEVSAKLSGTYEIVAHARSTATGVFDQMKSVKVTIGVKGEKAPDAIRSITIRR
jgi:hypothetical protein